MNSHLHIITGGPGAGKTTLLHELSRRGFACVPEVARQIIQEQVKTNGDALPWANTTKYTELMLMRSVADYRRHAEANTVIFMDRGIPDVLSYAQIIALEQQSSAGRSLAEAIQSACHAHRYNPHVFIAPPWEEIYHPDEERKQTYEDAMQVYEQVRNAYEECRYELIEIPRVRVGERAAFVLANLG